MADKDGQVQVLLPANSLSSQESSNQDAKEKQSPCDKSDITKTDSAACEVSVAAVQEEIFPLSGSPFFCCILVKSNVQGPCQLVVPRSFTHHLPKDNATFTLCCRNKIWEVGYYGAATLKRFDPRWRAFVNDNKLKMGDACIFELIDGKYLKFRVQILDGSLPASFRRESKGNNSDAPIVIDDDDDCRS